MRGANSRQAQRIVALLNVDHLCSISRPPRTYRKPTTLDYLWRRFLFRRHVQHILNWTTRREESDPEGFGSNVNNIIQEILFPKPKIHTHGQIEGGRQETSSATSCGGDQSIHCSYHNSRREPSSCRSNKQQLCHASTDSGSGDRIRSPLGQSRVSADATSES